MAKGKPTSKITKGAKGRKNHGPKRHLHHDIAPRALRMSIAKSGSLSKYQDYDSFCLAMQARGVRADYNLMWAKFRSIPLLKDDDDNFMHNRVAEKEFFDNAKVIGQELMQSIKKGAKS